MGSLSACTVYKYMYSKSNECGPALCACACVLMCLFVCVCTFTRTCKNTVYLTNAALHCVCVCVYVCMGVFVHVCMCVYEYVCMCKFLHLRLIIFTHEVATISRLLKMIGLFCRIYFLL